MRCFISIEIPDEIKNKIVKIQNQLPEFKGKLTEFENLHLTLKFLGEVDEKTLIKIKERLKEIKLSNFESEIDSIGFFDNTQSKIYPQKLIVWLHMKNCDKLQKEIDKKLEGLFVKEKRFMAHLTIVRIKDIEDKNRFLAELNKIRIPRMKFPVSIFNLKKSVLTEEGPVYETFEEYNLN